MESFSDKPTEVECKLYVRSLGSINSDTMVRLKTFRLKMLLRPINNSVKLSSANNINYQYLYLRTTKLIYIYVSIGMILDYSIQN